MGFNEQYNNIKQLTAPEIEIIEQKMIEDKNLPEPVNTMLKSFLLTPSKKSR